jgi:hypothetical protein
MKNNDDIMNNPKIKRLLSELEGKVHIPFELIVADAQGKLSSEGHSKVALHIKACKDCGEVFKLIKESLGYEKEGTDESGVASNIPVSAALQSKLKLAAAVNSKRDEIAANVAKLLLSKEAWFAIKPAIAAYRIWLNTSVEKKTVGRDELAVAAFTGGSSGSREDFEIIISSVKFADYICDMLVERCNSLEEIEQKLLEFVDEGMAIFGDTKFYDVTKNEIAKITKKVICDG